MEFALTDEQKMLDQSLRGFFAEHLPDGAPAPNIGQARR